jgi:hydroxymethylpyrimidine pyrophosphatase-like HAD family hydrolase
VLTPNARHAVALLGQAGILFAITSGRPPRGMQTLIKDLNISTVVAGFNGGVFATPRLDPIVMRDLPRGSTAHVIELIRDHGLVAWLYTDTVWYVQDPEGPHVDRESKTVGFGPEVAPDYSDISRRRRRSSAWAMISKLWQDARKRFKKS